MVSKQAQEASGHSMSTQDDEYCYPLCLCKLTTGPDLQHSSPGRNIALQKKQTYLRGTSFFNKKRQHSVARRTVLMCMQLIK